MDYLETEQERLETHLSQGENIFIQKRDEGFGKYDLQLNNGSEANSYHDIGLDTPKVQVRFVESNILSVQNHSKFEKERSNSGASQYKRDNLKDSINLNSNAGQNESRILNKNEVSIQSNRDDKKESFICNTQRKYFSKGQNLNSPNQDKFRSNLTKRSEFRSEFQQATVTNQFDFANASEETENITKSQRQYMKKSNKQVQQKNSNKFSLIIKTQKAIRMFKSYLIPRKVHRKAFQFINDISSVDQSVNNQTVFTPFVIIDRFAQQKYDIENCIRVFKASIIQYRTQIFKFLDDNATVFDPLNKWRVIFDIILIIGVGFAVFFNTVEIFFSIDFTEIYPHGYPVIDWSLFMMFLLDVVFNLNTGVYKQGSISYERLDIFNNYYNGRMFKDLLSLLTFIRKGNSHFVTSFFNLFIFFKVPFSMNLFYILFKFDQIYFKILNNYNVNLTNTNILNEIRLTQFPKSCSKPNKQLCRAYRYIQLE